MEQPKLLEIPDQGEAAKPLVTVSLPEEAPRGAGTEMEADRSRSAGVDDSGCRNDDRARSQGAGHLGVGWSFGFGPVHRASQDGARRSGASGVGTAVDGEPVGVRL